MKIRTLAAGLLAAIALLVSTLAGRAAPTDYLAVAVDAAKWIQRSKIPTANGVTWPADPRDPKTVSTALYSGSPGVVLFLIELGHATGDASYLTDAKKGADELIAQLPAQKGMGLYEGVAGIGFTLGETWRATKDDKYRRAALAAARTIQQRAQTAGKGVEWSSVTDIISGSAGIGLFLLYADETLGDPDARSTATRAGDRLIELGIADHGGTKWAMSPTFQRLMPNFSHGTAGNAYYLARLYQRTHERRFLDAALAGAKYLQAIAKTDGDVCLVQHDQPDNLDLYYLGWCHGPAGTARLFYQLAAVTGNGEWMTWVRKSANGILTSGIPERRTAGFWNNVSQCCGSAGVAQFFLDLNGATRDKRYLDFAEKVTADLLARATRDGQGTRWIQAENRIQPDNLVAQTGYMQGAAGMGVWLLRLDGAERKRDAFVRFPDSPWR